MKKKIILYSLLVFFLLVPLNRVEAQNIKTHNNAVNYIYLLPLTFLGISLVFCSKEKKEDVIETVSFYPPEGFNSLELAYLYSGNANDRDVTSLLIYLANKGYLKLSEYEEETKYGKIKSFKITKLKNYDGNNISERLFLTGLFKCAPANSLDSKGRIEVTESYLYDKFYKTANNILNNINNSINQNKIMVSSALQKKKSVILMIVLSYFIITIIPILNYSDLENYLFATFITSIGYSFLFSALSGQFVASYVRNKKEKTLAIIIAIILSAFYIIYPGIKMVFPYLLIKPIYLYLYLLGLISIYGMFICYKKLNKRTSLGNKLLGQIKGFRNFLETAEKDKLEALVKDDPSYFYSILPYTYVLGVSDEWVKKFESITIKAPSWYESDTSFDINSFSSFLSSAVSSASASMSSSSDSGESSSGGSSGGGSGGGGGGSW